MARIETPENTIAIENSTWNNIGDAFYQNSIMSIFNKVFPKWNIVSFDGPPQRAFRPKNYEVNVFDQRYITDAAHFVLSGPILGPKFLQVYAPFIEQIVKRGRSYSLLSVHGSGGSEVIDRIRDFFKKNPPTALHTRDHPTYDMFSDIIPCNYDGMCFAFFVSKMEGLPVLTNGEDYICSSYYTGYEPTFSNVSDLATDISKSGIKLTWPKHMSKQRWRLMRFFEHRKYSPTELGRWKIVRPVQAFSPLPQLIFSKKNSYISYNPNNFLAMYKYCSGVLTDRVHAGVAGLSFGKPVMVKSIDSRFALFERAPIIHEDGFMRISPGALDPYYDEIQDWLRNEYAAASGLNSRSLEEI